MHAHPCNGSNIQLTGSVVWIATFVAKPLRNIFSRKAISCKKMHSVSSAVYNHYVVPRLYFGDPQALCTEALCLGQDVQGTFWDLWHQNSCKHANGHPTWWLNRERLLSPLMCFFYHWFDMPCLHNVSTNFWHLTDISFCRRCCLHTKEWVRKPA